MTVNRLQQVVVDRQVESLYQFEAKRFSLHNEMYCPMCEDWHEANTWCQANMTQGGE